MSDQPTETAAPGSDHRTGPAAPPGRGVGSPRRRVASPPTARVLPAGPVLVLAPEAPGGDRDGPEAGGAPVPEPVPDRPSPSAVGPAGRVSTGWRQVLAVGVACFGFWLLLDAPTLYASASASPLGTRRSAALEILRPVSAVSRALGLSHVIGGYDRVLGRTGPGVVKVAGYQPRATVPPTLTPIVTTPITTVAGAAPPGPPPTAPDGLPPLSASPSQLLPVLSVGDSIGIDLGDSLVNDLAQTGAVSIILDAHVDTGLSRPDYFDWPAELRAQLQRYHSQAVVVFLGANDPQNFQVPGGAVSYGTSQWTAAYSARVGSFMAEATGSGARVLWIGMPPMADPGLNTKMVALNSIFETEAASHPGVSYFPSWPVLSDAQGHFQTYLPDGSGNEVDVRTPDGTHLSPAGADRLAQAVISAMDHDWGLGLKP